ncbi:malectin domain-containing carbohydrate-binding protein [Adhaeribacter radiodurans]|uniref:T9SS type A sorting domain-containing protein n=1 Tax=Adhaeribacter radiodurans TaxID=2745197 RepID=A0A7L7L3R8_9BACT|nr:malectin domain-containing carbohydrate-binding protein [Adhaeribacter radiodurans]QMU27420.1 hypothetical protein HUW48_04930 [Adhaeribacter radiodurans]
MGKNTFFQVFRYFFVTALLVHFNSIIYAQNIPVIYSTNGLLPNCATEKQELNLIINGSNFGLTENEEVKVRIRGSAFKGEVLFTPEIPNSSTQLKIIIPANNTVLSLPGTLTIDIQQLNSDNNKVFSNAVQLPVYPKTSPISGSTVVCGNSQNNYTVPKLNGAASYEWSVISGNASIISGSNRNTVRIHFANSIGTVKIGVKTLTSCGTSGTTSNLEVLVNAIPKITLPTFNDLCVNAPAIKLIQGVPAGGTYTVDGIVATSFDPSAFGVGEHTIIYYYNQNGCSASTSQIIKVLPGPSVAFSSNLGSICQNAAIIQLNGGSPANGTFSGPGVSGNTFDPAIAGIGSHSILYTVTQNGCTTSASQIINVLPAPIVDLPAFNDICNNAPAFALISGSPSGGIYTIDGKIATNFDPAIASIGSHTITYSFTLNGCTASVSQTIKVKSAPIVTFPISLQPVCVNAKPIILSEGKPGSGTFSGAGIIMDDDVYQTVRYGNPNTNFSYNIPVSTTKYTIILHFADINWNESGQRSFDVSIEGNKVLDNYDIVNKVGANTATTETFTVNVNDGLLNIDFIGLTSEGGKSDPTVSAIEVISTTLPSEIYRINAGGGQVINSIGEFASDNYFNGGDPFSVSKSIGGTPTTFNPALAGVGEHIITFSYSQNGCQNSATQNITVLDVPVAQISAPAEGTQVCFGQQVTLTANPVFNAKYQWFLNGNLISGAVSNSYNAEESGSYTIQVIDANCPVISDSVIVKILTPDNVIIDQGPVKICAGSDTTLHALTGNGYQYQWYLDGNRLVNKTKATLSVNSPGDYKVILTPLGCEPVTSAAITVTYLPEIINNVVTTNAKKIICSGSTVSIIGSQPGGGTGEYTYQWESRINNEPFTAIPEAINPDYSFATGTFMGSISFRRVVFSDSCLVISNELNFTVNQLNAENSISAPGSTTICAGNAPGIISSNTITGEEEYSYTWESSSNNAPFQIISGATSASFTPDILFQTTSFRRVMALGQCINISDTVTIQVNPEILKNNITIPFDLICSNSDPGTIAGEQVTGGDGTYRYIWERSLDGTTFTAISNSNTIDYSLGALTRTTTFRRTVISGACRNISNEVTVTVNPAILGNRLTESETTICVNNSPETINSEPITGGNGTYTYSWESSVDGNTFIPVPNLNTAKYNPGNLTQTTTYRRLVTSGVCTDTSNALTITVLPVITYTVFLTVAPSDFPVCGETRYIAQVIKNVNGINYPTDPHLQQTTWSGGEDATQQFLFDWWKNDEQRLVAGNTSGTLTLEALQPGDYYTVRARPISSDLSCAIFNSRPDLIVSNSGTNTLFSNRFYSGQPDAYSVDITSDAFGTVCPDTPVTFTATPNVPTYINPTFQWTINDEEIPGATQPVFTTALVRDNDVVSVLFNSNENSCDPITAGNPITMQVSASIPNRLDKIEGPEKPEVGKPATYRVSPDNNTLNWLYEWTITYKNGQTEVLPETSETLVIPKIPADLFEITVKKIAPPGSCVDQESTVVSTFTIPLPVELLYLRARETTNNVIVEWATAIEQNNAGFEVQVAADAINYRLLGFVPSKSLNSYTKQEYTFHDQEKNKSGTRYYRLKQENSNGYFSYFGPIAINILASEESLTAFPNPFTKEVNLVINTKETGDMHLIILNAIGSKVGEQTFKIKKGNNKEKILMNTSLPQGMYTLISQMNNQIRYLKLLKQ